jgi:hypothetical protein
MTKLTFKEFATLANWKEKHKRDRIFCNFYLTEEDEWSVVITKKFKIYVYILLFLPLLLLSFFICLWDGGLRNFEFPSYDINTSSYRIYKDGKGYKNYLNLKNNG